MNNKSWFFVAAFLYLVSVSIGIDLGIDADSSRKKLEERALLRLIQQFFDAFSLSNEDLRDEFDSICDQRIVVILADERVLNGKQEVIDVYNEELDNMQTLLSALDISFEQQSADISAETAEIVGTIHLLGTLKADNSTVKRDVRATFKFSKAAGTWRISREQCTLLKQEVILAESASRPDEAESSDGTLHHADPPPAIRVKGEPFFLICARSAVISEFAEYKRAGFNTVYTHQPEKPGLDEAQEQGLYVIHSFPDYLYSKQGKQFPPAYWLQVKQQVSQWKDHPALLAWVQPTDASVHKYNPLEIREVYNLTENGSNTKVRILNFGAPNNLLNNYLDFANVLVYESWPDKNASVVPDKMDRFLIAAQGRPVWYLQQVIEGHNVTSIEEFRSKIFLAVNHGATGVMIEGFREHLWPEWGTGDKYVSMGDPKLADMRKEAMRIARQLNLLAPAVLAGSLTENMCVSDPKVDVRAFIEPDTDILYLVAVNSSDKPLKQSFTLPETKANVVVIDENRRIAVQSNMFTDNFKPYETHLYRLKISSK